MKTTKGMMGLVCWVIFIFCGSVLAGETVGSSPENGMEEAVGGAAGRGLAVAPLAYEGSSNTLFGTGAGNSLGTDNDLATFIGFEAGYHTNTGSENTFVGFRSGYDNTTGYWNTFIGKGAGYDNTTGYENTFLGKEAGGVNTTGNENTFVGSQAGVMNTVANFNTFIGNDAGYWNTGGSSNTFVGQSAGYFNTTSTGNGFFGNSAGRNNTTGNYNSFFGYQTGNSNTTGYFNTFLGVEAGYTNSTGIANVHIGRQAGYASNGGGNVYIGHMTARTNTTGLRNTMIGEFAGQNNITGGYNVFLGWGAGENETGSNRLYIDVNNTTTPLIYGQFDNRRLTVNGNLEVIGPDNGLVRLSNVVTNNTTKAARMVVRHYSNAEEPVYLFGAASTATDNFVAFGGGATIGNAATQIDLYTAPNTTTLAGTPRITIKGNGFVGIGTQNPTQPLQMAGGAFTNGAQWIDASSREYKEDIESLTSEEALEAIRDLNPVKFAYKTDRTAKHVGFIAEEVPGLVATKDRKGLSPMDIVAVLTKVVQEQQHVVQELKAENEAMKQRLLLLEGKAIASK